MIRQRIIAVRTTNVSLQIKRTVLDTGHMLFHNSMDTLGVGNNESTQASYTDKLRTLSDKHSQSQIQHSNS